MIRRIQYLLDEIQEKETTLRNGADAWSKGEDPSAMADCDPGIQFELSVEIDTLWREVKSLVDAKVGGQHEDA